MESVYKEPKTVRMEIHDSQPAESRWHNMMMMTLTDVHPYNPHITCPTVPHFVQQI